MGAAKGQQRKARLCWKSRRASDRCGILSRKAVDTKDMHDLEDASPAAVHAGLYVE